MNQTTFSLLSFFQPFLILTSLIIQSFIIGIPLAWYFTKKNERNSSFVFTFFYTASILGYSILNLVIFFIMLILKCGTGPVSLYSLLILLLISIIFLYIKKDEIIPDLKFNYKILLIFSLLLPFASLHIILPMISGKWEMAYATGDDASRWYMVVNYFQDHFFEYWKNTDVTLYWRLGERPLQNISGSIIASIFQTNSAIAYSMSSAMAMIMSALSFCLLYEAFFPIKTEKNRFYVWLIAILFFGIFGSFTNIFYTGRTTHHFSIYPVIASLGFFAYKDKGLRYILWFVLWSVLLAYYYSIRFSFSYITLAGFMIFFQWLFKQIRFIDFFRNGFFLVVSCVIGGLAAWGETKVLLQSGMEFLSMQRGSDYGSDGTFWDRVFKWSGFLGTYDSYEYFSTLLEIGLFCMIVFALLLVFYSIYKTYKTSPAYLGLIVFSLISATIFFLSRNYYVAWKSALYWPIYALLGGLASGIFFIEEKNILLKKFGYLIILFFCLYIFLTGRQMKAYYAMTDLRYTKVDKHLYELRDSIKGYLEKENKVSGTIFGYDYSVERYLLIREVFKDFDWIPLRGNGLWYEHDIVNPKKINYDNYKYDILLYANCYGNGEWIDISGNDNSLILEKPPFKVFNEKSSFVEFNSSFETTLYERNDVLQCPMYGSELIIDTGKVNFINRGQHNWLKMKFKIINENNKIDSVLKFGTNSDKANYNIELIEKKPEYSDYLLTFSNLKNDTIFKINFTKLSKKGKDIVTLIRWGY